VRNH